MKSLVLRYSWPVLVFPLAGCTSAPIAWVVVALVAYGLLTGLYPDR